MNEELHADCRLQRDATVDSSWLSWLVVGPREALKCWLAKRCALRSRAEHARNTQIKNQAKAARSAGEKKGGICVRAPATLTTRDSTLHAPPRTTIKYIFRENSMSPCSLLVL
jgi:hypothetical protein